MRCNPVHGLIKRHAQHIDKQVDRMALSVLVGPSPVVVFYDEGDGIFGVDIASESGAIKLIDEVGLDVFGCQLGDENGIGDPGTDFLVYGQGQGLHEVRLAQ